MGGGKQSTNSVCSLLLHKNDFDVILFLSDIRNLPRLSYEGVLQPGNENQNGTLLCLSSLLGRSQWPRGLRCRSAAASPAEIVGSNPTEGMDICLL